MFYTYRQNNSGGFDIGPAKYVVIEARTPEEADDIAENNGLYFDGCNAGLDCHCCGDRWNRSYEHGSDNPEVYGEPAKEFVDVYADKIQSVMIIYSDGNVWRNIDES